MKRIYSINPLLALVADADNQELTEYQIETLKEIPTLIQAISTAQKVLVEISEHRSELTETTRKSIPSSLELLDYGSDLATLEYYLSDFFKALRRAHVEEL